MDYSIVTDRRGSRADIVRREADGALVPVDADTADGRDYQAWRDAGGAPAAPAAPAAPTLAETKAQLRAALADRRWRAETAGTMVSGLSLSTDEKTQGKLTAAVVASVLDNDYAVNWKLADGSFLLFDHATLIAVAQGVRAHVQSCFDREAQLVAAIDDAPDIAALTALDIEAGWPA